MKFTIILFVMIFVQCANSYSALVNWKTRMRKYSELLNCEYYLTSENVYKDYFKFDNGQNSSDHTNHTQYRFYTLSNNSIKFALSDADYSASFLGNSFIQYEFVIGERSNGSSANNNGGNNNENGDASNARNVNSLSHFKREELYNPLGVDGEKCENSENNIARSSGVELAVSDILGESNVLSYVKSGSQRLKSLATPEIFRTDQPNEFLVEIFDGKVRLTINENTPFEIRLPTMTELNFISFAVTKNYNLEEFFYDCRLN